MTTNHIIINMNSEMIENVKINIAKGLELFDKEAIRRNIEIWRPIEGYPNYVISSKGNVKNVVTKRILKPVKSKKGYYNVNLHNKGEGKKMQIHRLVALTFFQNLENKPFVDHKNNIKTDNSVNNLRFATNIENCQNQSIAKNNTSNVKGVSFDKTLQKWRAQITINRKIMYIGCYNTLEEAKEARQNKAKSLFGEFTNACEK